jgi:NADP-dependent aldehyde dehydrogenase
VAWQNAPTDLLPAELADDHHDIPRRIDGVLVLPPHDRDE